MTAQEKDNFNMVAFMAHLSIMIEKMEQLKTLNVYERKIKMRGNALLKELDDYDRGIANLSMKVKESGHLEAQMQYAEVRDSLGSWSDSWERFIQLPPDVQIDLEKHILTLFSFYEKNKNGQA